MATIWIGYNFQIEKRIVSPLEEFPPSNNCGTPRSKKEQFPQKLFTEIRYLNLNRPPMTRFIWCYAMWILRSHLLPDELEKLLHFKWWRETNFREAPFATLKSWFVYLAWYTLVSRSLYNYAVHWDSLDVRALNIRLILMLSSKATQKLLLWKVIQ